MDRLLIVLIVAVVAVTVAAALRRLRPDTAPIRAQELPTSLDRRLFSAPGSPWLVAVFSSATCLACADVLRAARAVESDSVVVQDIEAVVDKGLHRRYGIDSVPTTVVADATGAVRAGWVGPLSPDDRAELLALTTGGS